MIDDSSLFHGTYDPVKAREYYLRTRELKGRRPGRKTPAPAGRTTKAETTSFRMGRKSTSARNKKRRAELKAKKALLEKRLRRLEEILRQKVKDAKKLNAPAQPKKATKTSSKTSTTRTSSKSSRSEKRDRKPETQSQKRERAKKAKEAYEKENPNSLSKDIEILQLQIQDIRSKIQKATEDARNRKPAGSELKKVRTPRQTTRSDGPRGR